MVERQAGFVFEVAQELARLGYLLSHDGEEDAALFGVLQDKPVGIGLGPVGVWIPPTETSEQSIVASHSTPSKGAIT